MKIAIIGSRGFKNLDKVTEEIQVIRYTYNPNELTIISGGASGVDRHAADIARRLNLEVEEFTPNFAPWGGYTPMAYHERNDKIIAASDHLFAFWDGSSPGTRSVINKCLERRKDVTVIFDR